MRAAGFVRQSETGNVRRLPTADGVASGAPNFAWRGGFSLIELLVSLTVLAVLIGILLPGLHHAVRVSAPLVKCSNNLSQLYRSVNLYLADSNGVLPLASYQPLRDGNQRRLDETLDAYGGGSELWLCPIDPRVQNNPRRIGSYLYPVAKLQASRIRVFMTTLPQQFPLFVDRNAFHAVQPLSETQPMLAGKRSGDESLMDAMFRYNPGLGYNRVNSNGKITAYPNLRSPQDEDDDDRNIPKPHG